MSTAVTITPDVPADLSQLDLSKGLPQSTIAYIDAKNAPAPEAAAPATPAQPGDANAAEVTPQSKDAAQAPDATKPEADATAGLNLSDEIRERVASHGLDPKQFAGFSSPEDVDRALDLHDQRIIKETRDWMATNKGAKPEVTPPAAKPTPGTPPPEAGASLTPIADEFERSGYEKPIVELLRKQEREKAELQQQLDQSHQRHEQEANQAAVQQHVNLFDAICDSLDPELLGTKGDGELPADKAAVRKKLWDEHLTLLLGQQARGIPVNVDAAFLKRAMRSAFSEELNKRETARRTADITKQSGQRLGGGTRKGSASLPAEARTRNELKEIFQGMLRDNGSA